MLEKQVPMYHLDDDNRYCMIMGVGPEGPDGKFTQFSAFQVSAVRARVKTWLRHSESCCAPARGTTERRDRADPDRV